MQVIMLKNVDNVGRMGQTVSVARGFARNYLVPNGLAVEASEGSQKLVAEKMVLENKHDSKRKDAAEAVKAQYAGKELAVRLDAKAGEDGRLYGSVSARDIADALTKQNFALDHRQVQLVEPIKQVGEYEVPVRLHPEVEIVVKVHVGGTE